VCAHSNGAIDELVDRILTRSSPFVDEFGNAYTPSIVRIGSRAKGECSLDERVAERERTTRGKMREAGGPEVLKRQLFSGLKAVEQEVAKWAAWCAMLQNHLDDPATACSSPSSTAAQPSSAASGCRACGWPGWAQCGMRHEQHVARCIEEAEGRIIYMMDTDVKTAHSLLNAMAALPNEQASSSSTAAASSREASAARRDRSSLRSLEALVLGECEIVFCTMSAAAEHSVGQVLGGFGMVLLDEAAQAGEISSLVPMAHGARLVVLVGDPKQLPATVRSPAARAAGFGRSLFERLQTAGHPALLLQTQYRMHGAIRAFPSARFYDSLLIDSESISRMMRRSPGTQDGPPALFSYRRPSSAPVPADDNSGRGPRIRPQELRYAPYAFINVQGGHEQHGDQGHEKSLRNKGEAALCAALVLGLHGAARAAVRPGDAPLGPCKHGARCGWGDLCGRVVMLTPYKAQADELARALQAATRGLGLPQDGVGIRSVDSYQGREADVVLFSCVRASSGSIGFVKDEKRLNVALTRARHALYIIGSESALRAGSPHWRALVDDARSRELWSDFAASNLNSAVVRGELSDFRRLAATAMRHLPITLLDGSREGSHAPPPREGVLAELQSTRGRPSAPPPIVPRWNG